MNEKTYTPAIGSWAWMCCALQDGMKVRKPEWTGTPYQYIHIPVLATGVIRAQNGCTYGLGVFINGWELYEEPQKPITLEPHTFLWAYAKAMASGLRLRPVEDWTTRPSTITYKILYGVLVDTDDTLRPLHLTPAQLVGKWEVL